MKPKVYLETTIVSYLTARVSPVLLVAAHQEVTQQWWVKVRPLCSLFVSPTVWDEISLGDPDQVRARTEAIRDLPSLDIDDRVIRLADTYSRRLVLPVRARPDAYHLAAATVHSIDYLLSWNCAHIASARVRILVSAVNEQLGHKTPTICTPEELMEV